jgi:hypothetical protein
MGSSATPVAAPGAWQAPSPVASPNAIASRRVSIRWIGLAASAVVALLVIGAIVWLMLDRQTAAPVTPVLVVIDASPWASVRGILTDKGEKQPLPQNASTPLAISLTPGSYRVSLVGPPPTSELREVALEVHVNTSAKVYERFGSMTADDYLRDILQARNEKRGAPGQGR